MGKPIDAVRTSLPAPARLVLEGVDETEGYVVIRVRGKGYRDARRAWGRGCLAIAITGGACVICRGRAGRFRFICEPVASVVATAM